ncbi:O-6-methylguanine DNA methyltransferase [Croceifilum oryzae]|uniref:Methylated-DNA--protein-cysteine methyltransferase n=1 Tax=Croceifilum oryzae TaxID=1553429 RepID=A0AAJ1TD68_9BACL|nr:methylated-DNA--[protein]-cysteine S-methyltransferase [Croceifilum oryzae]MDQ0416658.1 O-6-methylguanine DNA methyltransferase [Croceifilum oryzae]
MNQCQPIIAWSTLKSQVGVLTVAVSQQGLCYLDFPKKEDPILGLRIWVSKQARSTHFEQNEQACTPVLTQLLEYFDRKRKEFDLPLDLTGTPFQQLVYRQLCKIPYGTVASYKQVAEAIGVPKAVRAVGGANNKNPISIIVPCHRVIGANGSLVGYGGGLEIKKNLLQLEGFSEYKD